MGMGRSASAVGPVTRHGGRSALWGLSAQREVAGGSCGCRRPDVSVSLPVLGGKSVQRGGQENEPHGADDQHSEEDGV